VSKSKPKKDWRRTAALHLAAQLPDDPQDALQVLEYAKELVNGFLMKGKTVLYPTSVEDSSPSSADSASASLRAISTLRPRMLPE